MDLTKYYPDIVAKYPAYVTKRELCEICHICPKTAYNLEQQGEIPYTIEQNHLIRSHKIKLTDILAYLYRRECRQEADSPYICAMRTFYDEHLSPYHAALFLMASHPALFQKMDRYLCPEGIDFTKMMRKEEFEYDWMKITADAARNLFSWNSKCAATPFEISRMPAPAIRALFTACFIANGDYMVSVRENDKGEKVFEIDDSAGKRREAFNLQMEQMMEAPGMEPD